MGLCLPTREQAYAARAPRLRVPPSPPHTEIIQAIAGPFQNSQQQSRLYTHTHTHIHSQEMTSSVQLKTYVSMTELTLGDCLTLLPSSIKDQLQTRPAGSHRKMCPMDCHSKSMSAHLSYMEAGVGPTFIGGQAIHESRLSSPPLLCCACKHA